MQAFLSASQPSCARCLPRWRLAVGVGFVALLRLLVRLPDNDASSIIGLPPKGGYVRMKDPLAYLNVTVVPAYPPVQSLFSCQAESLGTDDPSESHKLVFLHVLKTAGTTLRQYLAKYASKCHLGWLEVQCSAPDPSTIGPLSEEWVSRAQRSPCKAKSHVLRSGLKRRKTEPVRNGFVSSSIDIMGGHMPLGTGRAWPSASGEDRAHYISFFRNAATKYVSGESFWKPETDLNELVKETKQKVHRALQRNEYHNKYAIYLLTPEQRDKYSGSISEGSVQVMVNLLERNVLAGVTERMDQSMELLQNLVDNGPKATDIFQERIEANPSKLSSSTVMDELVQDVEFMSELLECVKFDQQISDFAVALHLRQYASIERVN